MLPPGSPGSINVNQFVTMLEALVKNHFVFVSQYKTKKYVFLEVL